MGSTSPTNSGTALHCQNGDEQIAVHALLVHAFFIEHNFGHHLNVATPADGATARYNQTVYGFWFTSVTKQYVNAWRLQMDLLKRQGRSFLSFKNDMLWYHLIQPAYLGAVWFLFSFETMLCAVGAGVISFLF